MTPFEQELADAMATGSWAGAAADGSPIEDPNFGGGSSLDRAVRAEVLADLPTRTPTEPPRRVLRLVLARITGQLNLQNAKVACPVTLMNCQFDEPVNLLEATVPSLDLLACHLPELILMRARVDGQLNLSGTTLSNPGGIALNGDGLIVGRNLLCRGLTVTGAVLLRTARIHGQLSLADASLRNPGNSVLHANRLTVDQDLHCTLPWYSKPWSYALDALVAYGYRTGQAALWLLALIFAGWKIFDIAYPAHLAPAKPATERPGFHALLYTLDLLLPVSDLNYQNSWIAQDWARRCWLGWILAGWMLTIAVLAALSGVLKRD